MMRIGWKHLAAFCLAAPVALLLFVWSGLFDIRASTGHWRATDWFLHWAMRSSVRTAALPVAVPDLSDLSLLPAAAGHFETGCALCHGSPAAERPATVLGMLPPPPDLADVAASWTDAQLFEIIKHGVRYTGMPAWPRVGRDDEVWSMVAFVKALPQMTPQTYRQLSGNVSVMQLTTLDRAIVYCDSCHATSPDRPTLAPLLAGQSELYLRDSLTAYATNARPSGIMAMALSRIDGSIHADLAAYYGRQARGPDDDAAPAKNADPDISALAQTGSAERKIPACLSCHGNSGNPNYPRLHDLSPAYIAAQLRLFVKGERGGTAFAHLMTKAAKKLDEADIVSLAAYFGE